MPVAVTDPRSNPNDQIAHAANALKLSRRRRKVFIEIYHGRKKAKTVDELVRTTKLKRQAVLDEGKKLAGLHIVNQIRIDGKMAYEKDTFYATNKERILNFATNPAKLKALPTKYSPKTSSATGQLRVIVQGAKVEISLVTCDDFEQFAKVKKIKSAPPQEISEKAFKAGVLKLIGDSGRFTDWGGEKNDLYTNKLKHRGQRRAIAFAFKGPGMQGTLTPKKLGKNGDQIQRLFLSAAEIFIVQYHSQIDQSVIEQMIAFATLNSVRERKRIWYGVIDGDDTNRLLKAYPRQFGLPK
jgi:hypothetical protein